MRNPGLAQSSGQDAFTDLLFNALLGFASMFVVAFLLISDKGEQGNVDAKAEVLITVRWPDRHPDDVDLIVEDPRGNLAWYHNRDTGLMHLDRDDRGRLQDRLVVDGEEISNPVNQETVSVRRLVGGEYVVNVLHYQATTKEPLPVSVTVEKLNPVVSVVWYGNLQLAGGGDEQTAIRFSINQAGEVTGVSSTPKSLLVSVRK